MFFDNDPQDNTEDDLLAAANAAAAGGDEDEDDRLLREANAAATQARTAGTLYKGAPVASLRRTPRPEPETLGFWRALGRSVALGAGKTVDQFTKAASDAGRALDPDATFATVRQLADPAKAQQARREAVRKRATILRDGLEVEKSVEAVVGRPAEGAGFQLLKEALPFLTGFALTKRVMGNPIAGTGVKAGIANSALQGAPVDAAIGYRDERLSNLAQNGPAWLAKPLAVLAANPNDGEATARIKAVVEGAFTGIIADGVLAGLGKVGSRAKEVRAGRKQLASEIAAKAPALAPDVTAAANPAVKASPAAPPRADDVVVEPVPESGKVRVRAKSAAAKQLMGDNAPVFDTPEAAAVVAGNVQSAVRNAQLPRNIKDDPAAIEAIRRKAREFVGDEELLAKLRAGEVDETTAEWLEQMPALPFRYDQSPDELVANVMAFADTLKDELRVNRASPAANAGPTGTVTNAASLAQAAEQVKGAGSLDGFNAQGLQAAESVREAGLHMLATMAVRQELSRQVETMYHVLTATNDDPVRMRQAASLMGLLGQTMSVERRLASESGRMLQLRQADASGLPLGKLADALRGDGEGLMDMVRIEVVDEPLTEGVEKAVDAVRGEGGPTPAPEPKVAQKGSQRPKKGTPEPEPDPLVEAAGSADPSITDVLAPKPEAAPKAKKPKAPKEPAEPAAPKADTDGDLDAAADDLYPREGENTYTLVDEAEQILKDAEERVAKIGSEAPKAPTDDDALRALDNLMDDPDFGKLARDVAGTSAGERKLAQERLAAARKIARKMIADARKAAPKADVLADLSDDEVNDLAALLTVRDTMAASRQLNSPIEAPATPKPPKAKDAAEPKDKANVGPNTFRVVDEDSYKLKQADERIKREVEKLSKLTPEERELRNDKLLLKQIERDLPRLEALGITAEKRAVVQQYLKDIRENVARRRQAAGVDVIDANDLDIDMVRNLEALTVGRFNRLYEKATTAPVVPRSQKVVHVTPSQLRAMMRDFVFTSGSAKERDRALKALFGDFEAAAKKGDVGPTVVQRVLSYQRWAMLSNMATAVTNIVSAMTMLPVRTIGHAVGGVLLRDAVEVRRAQDMMAGMILTYGDTIREAAEALETGRVRLDGLGAFPEQAALRDAGDTTPAGLLMNALRVTERFMLAGDELAKQFAYRGHVYAQAMEIARLEGLDSAKARLQALGDVKRSVGPNGEGVNLSGLAFAQDISMRAPLDGAIAGSIERLMNGLPIIKALVMPFVKVPLNLQREAVEMIPGVGFGMKRSREAFSAGGSNYARADQLGKQAIGAVTFGAAMTLAANGLLTGRGPKDPELRARWTAAGNEPYTIKTPLGDIPYGKIEPLATMLKYVADYHDIMGEIGDDKAKEATAWQFVAAFGSAFTEKANLRNLSDLLEAAGSQSPDKWRKFASNAVGTFIPNMARAANDDELNRATYSFVEDLIERVPGWSTTLEPQRNIMGEKVYKPVRDWESRVFNPFSPADLVATPLDQKLLDLRAQISMPEPKKFGVDLRERKPGEQSAYDRWLEIMGQGIKGSSYGPIRKTLEEFVESDVFKTQLTDDVNGIEGSRNKALKSLISGYRQAAFAQLVTERPELLDKIIQSASLKAEVLTGDDDFQMVPGVQRRPSLSSTAEGAANALLGTP